jgi:hypothetical protein
MAKKTDARETKKSTAAKPAADKKAEAKSGKKTTKAK